VRWLLQAALLVAMSLTACGGGRSASGGNDQDLAVSQVGPSSVAAGTTATFTALVVNAGRNNADNIVITETLTAGYTATVTCVASVGAICPATLGPTMTLPSLSPGRSPTLTYAVAVPADKRGDIVNQVAVSSSTDVDLSDNSATVVDLFAATDEAYAALWRVLLGLDLVDKVTGWKSLALDDPLPLLLTDARQVHTTALQDGLWSRVLDVPAALAARTYAVEIDVVLDVHDDFLHRGGRVRLQGGPEGATCTPTDASADLALPVATLGPLLFGGGRASTYARAGRATGTPDVLRRVDAAFSTDREPLHGTGF